MFTQEKAKEGMEKYSAFLGKLNIKPGIVYNALGDFVQNQRKITEFVFDVSHFRFEEGVHLDLILLSNMQQIDTLHFYFKDDLPEPATEFIISDLKSEDIFDVENLSELLKVLVVGNIKKEIYLEEKARAEAELKRITDFIKENKIEE